MKPLLVNDRNEIIEEPASHVTRGDNRIEQVRAQTSDESARPFAQPSALRPNSANDSATASATPRVAPTRPFERSQTASSPDLMSLRARLLAAASGSLRELQNSAAQIAQAELGATLVAWFHPAGSRSGSPNRSKAFSVQPVAFQRHCMNSFATPRRKRFVVVNRCVMLSANH